MKNKINTISGGFTLIELLVVMLIIGVLASIGVPRYFRVVERSRGAEIMVVGHAMIDSVSRECMRRNVTFPVNEFAEDDSEVDITMPALSGFYSIGDGVKGSCAAFEIVFERTDKGCSGLSGCKEGMSVTIQHTGEITYSGDFPSFLQL